MKDKKHIHTFEQHQDLNISDVSRSFTIQDLENAFESGRKYTTDAFNEEHWEFDYDDFKSWFEENYD